MRTTICIFCGSNEGSMLQYKYGAYALAQALAERGAGIVYGGGSRGLMGEIARAALDNCAPLTGIVPGRFRSDRLSPPLGAEYRFVDTMQERKQLMRDLSEGFAVLPGGIGTIDEIVETLMLKSLGFHDKPLAVLDIGGYFRHFFEFLDDSTRAGFMKPSLLNEIFIDEDPAAIANFLLSSIEQRNR